MAWLGVFNAFLFAIIILAKWKRSPTKYFLSGFLISVGIVAAGSLAVSSKVIFDFPALAYLHSPFSFLVAPLLFLTVRSSQRERIQVQRIAWLHLLPFLIAIGLHLPFYVLSTSEKLLYLNQAYEQLPINREVFFWTVISQSIIYLSVTWLMLIKRHRAIETQYLRWSIVFSIFLTLLIGVALFRKLSLYSYDHSYLMATLLTAWMAYAIYHFLNPGSEKQSLTGNKYLKSGLTKNDSEQNVKRLMGYLDNQKPYLDSGFSLIEASTHLGLKPNYLSQSINQNLNKTFTEVLNECRIRQAAEMITNPNYNHLTIEGIGNEVGFKSKSAFYINFRKQLGKSPKQFKLSFK